MEFVPGIVKAAIALFILGCVITIPIVIGSAAIHFWYLSVPLIALVIFVVVHFRRQKADANRV